MIITIAMMPCFKYIASSLKALDKPNERKVHTGVIPKCGGMAMAAGTISPIILWAPMTPLTKAILIGSLILVFFGVMDDIKDLGFKPKFATQFGAALSAILIGGIKINKLGALLPSGMMLPDWIAIPLTIVVIVGVTNATNLADGLDGLAGGISLLIFICIGYFGFAQGDMTVVLFSIAIGGAILGFLRFNSYPAQLFMGDAGSQLLGYTAIVLSLKLSQSNGGLNALLPLFFIGLPIVDTLTVMTKRLVQGKPPFVADKKHFHHQLMGIGLYHSEAVLSIYIIQSFFIVLGITLQSFSEWFLLISYLVYSLTVVVFFLIVEKTHFRLNRTKFLNPFKARLRAIKERGLIIKFSFQMVKVGVPAVFILNCFIPTPQNESYFIFASGFLIIVIISWFFKRDLVGQITKLGLYVVTPFLVYAGDRGIYQYMGSKFVFLYNSLFGLLFLFLLLTLNFTRRKTRFQSTPLDFLVVFIIFLISSLPNTVINDYQLGLVAVKTVILFFGYEVLVGELRHRSNKLTTASLILLALVGLKGLISAGYLY
jgi:UDP-GlcNAc:undecaprenyl-phosphate GlcNAc-1-phosphate transferase